MNKYPDGDGKNVNTRFRFPGQYRDWETQTHYNYFRTYDPTLGRYTQHDPIGLDGGMNPYGYVRGDPVTGFDLTGELSFLVGRELGFTSLAGHLYVVSHAECLGDKRGKVYSFGKTNNGTVGRVYFSTEGFSEGTHLEDILDWLRKSSATSSGDVIEIPSKSDSIVAYYANNLRENLQYKLLGPNSNSASKAVAIRAALTYVPTPTGRPYPGDGNYSMHTFY